MTQEPQHGTRATRRGLLAGVGLVGLAGAVSACSSGGSSSSSAATNAGTAGAGATPAATSGGNGAAGGALAATSEIPVGSGKIFASQKVVVTQPTSGEYKGFSAICTHMQCTVDQISNGTIDCPCHGSQFSIKDGSVVAGPAPSPLPTEKINVSGTSIFLS